jgi:hypothetical protein
MDAGAGAPLRGVEHLDDSRSHHRAVEFFDGV